MGNYKICDFCGNLYERTNNRMCQSCEEVYRKIRSIVEVKPDTIVLEISNQTGVSVSRILSFVRNGYFVMKEGTIEVNN
ncbi:hypothetical protein V3851_03090 [Paenibacillus sp. M1]|uniref:Flagellar protein n=1 Tax=Paenibacillus haidiansis TaxID=1574488 RepID=A0ABU7VPG0_9BACL